MKKTYIEFFFPGPFVSESETKEVADRSAPRDVPRGAYGYRFFSRTEVECDGETLRGQATDTSGMHYYGEILTIDDVEKIAGTGILQSNMRCNRWDKVVRTVRGNFQPLTGDDVVIATPPPWAGADKPN